MSEEMGEQAVVFDIDKETKLYYKKWKHYIDTTTNELGEKDNLILFLEKQIVFLESLKPSCRTVQEIREYCESKITPLLSDNNLYEGHNAYLRSAYKDVIDFIDSGESDDVCVWKKWRKDKPDCDYATECGNINSDCNNDIFCGNCGRKIKREE